MEKLTAASPTLRYLALFILVFGAASSSQAWGAEIKVNLFGQPCTLSGPPEESVLKVIHSISPEQAYPTQTASDFLGPPAEQIRVWLKKLQSAPGVPPELDRYRERLGKRLEAQAAFFDSLAESRKSHQAKPLLLLEKKYFRAGESEDFSQLAQKVAANESKRELVDPLFDSFNEKIEADPEEEFHRAIRKMNVQYNCSFEEPSHDSP